MENNEKVDVKKGAIIFIGETFRTGTQGTRIRGNPESYAEQITACKTHVKFMEDLQKKYNLEKVDAYIASYNTPYDKDLLSIYEGRLAGKQYYPEPIGPNTLYTNTLNSINLYDYDFILFIRIDLYLKPEFTEVFDPTINKILFPSVLWLENSRIHEKYPKVNDIIQFIPKKYYKHLNVFNYGDGNHDSWYLLVTQTELTIDDLDTMLKSYHDADSYKDWNPLYYVVNRPESQIHHSKDAIFDKYTF